MNLWERVVTIALGVVVPAVLLAGPRLARWYVVRCAETGKPIPEDVLAERQGKRDRINELQEQIRRSLWQQHNIR